MTKACNNHAPRIVTVLKNGHNTNETHGKLGGNVPGATSRGITGRNAENNTGVPEKLEFAGGRMEIPRSSGGPSFVTSPYPYGSEEKGLEKRKKELTEICGSREKRQV